MQARVEPDAKAAAAAGLDGFAVLKTLLRHHFHWRVLRYLTRRAGSTGCEALAMRLWAQVQLESQPATWYFPTHEVFLDVARLACEHMRSWGLEEFMQSCTLLEDARYLESFWKFEDAPLTHRVLQCIMRVVDRHFQSRLAVDQREFTEEALVKLFHEETDLAPILWGLFGRFCQILTRLYDANMTQDFAMHCQAVQHLLRNLIHVHGHEVVDAGLIDVLIPYQLLLRTHENNERAVGWLFTPRRFWAYRDISFRPQESRAFSTHFSNPHKVLFSRMEEKLESSWLFASDDFYDELHHKRIQTLLDEIKEMALGQNTADFVVELETKYFIQGLSHPSVRVVTQSLEVLCDLEELTNSRALKLQEPMSGMPDVSYLLLLDTVKRLMPSSVADAKAFGWTALPVPAPSLALLLSAVDIFAGSCDRRHAKIANHPSVTTAILYGFYSEQAQLCEISAMLFSRLMPRLCEYWADSPEEPCGVWTELCAALDRMLHVELTGRRIGVACLICLAHLCEALPMGKLELHLRLDTDFVCLVTRACRHVMLGTEAEAYNPDTWPDFLGDSWTRLGKQPATACGGASIAKRLVEYYEHDYRPTILGFLTKLLRHRPDEFLLPFVIYDGVDIVLVAINKTRQSNPDLALKFMSFLLDFILLSPILNVALLAMKTPPVLLPLFAKLGKEEGVQDSATDIIFNIEVPPLVVRQQILHKIAAVLPINIEKIDEDIEALAQALPDMHQKMLIDAGMTKWLGSAEISSTSSLKLRLDTFATNSMPAAVFSGKQASCEATAELVIQTKALKDVSEQIRACTAFISIFGDSTVNQLVIKAGLPAIIFSYMKVTDQMVEQDAFLALRVDAACHALSKLASSSPADQEMVAAQCDLPYVVELLGRESLVVRAAAASCCIFLSDVSAECRTVLAGPQFVGLQRLFDLAYDATNCHTATHLLAALGALRSLSAVPGGSKFIQTSSLLALLIDLLGGHRVHCFAEMMAKIMESSLRLVVVVLLDVPDWTHLERKLESLQSEDLPEAEVKRIYALLSREGATGPNDFVQPPKASTMRASDILWKLAQHGILVANFGSRADIEKFYDELVPPAPFPRFLEGDEPPSLIGCLCQLWLAHHLKTLYSNKFTADMSCVGAAIESAFAVVVHWLHHASLSSDRQNTHINLCCEIIAAAKLPPNDPLQHLVRLFKSMTAPPRRCSNCGKLETKEQMHRACSGCRKTQYCSVPCQRNHWRTDHKAQCKKSAAAITAPKTPSVS